MEPVTIELSNFRSFLSQYDVEVHEYYTSAEEYYKTSPIYPPNTSVTGIEVFINGKLAFSNDNPNCEGNKLKLYNRYDKISNEFNHNINLPVSKAKLTKYILDLVSIIFDVDKRIYTKKIIYDGSTIHIFTLSNAHISFEKNRDYFRNYVEIELHHILYEIKIKNQNLLIEIVNWTRANMKGLILLTEGVAISEEKRPKYNSFTLTSDIDLYSEAFTNFYSLLIEEEFIAYPDIRLFRHIFSNRIPTPPIKWTWPKKGSKGYLYYFIRELYSRKIVVGSRTDWQVASRCFLFRNNEPIVPENISKSKKPINTKHIENLNGILDVITPITS